ncbi:MAG: lipoate--protein ligase family protein [Candidatus Omnitrophica bacterium]|nr:lipoate--protein ligase family protein [Candidatus Omnitrophota bacterium]
MIFKDITFPTPQENILYDNVLLELAEHGEGEEALRFWESQELFIVLGRIGNPAADLRVEKVLADRVPVLRRSSGGGTVVQGKGCLNYTLVLSKERPEIHDLRRSYQFILGRIITALKVLKVDAVCRPLSDIALTQNNKKISGNAQKRSKKFVLHHGTLLYGFDLKKIENYLTMPKDVPEYRQNRSHSDFVANIPATADALKQEIQKSFSVTQEENRLSSAEKECLQHFRKLPNVTLEIAG